MKQRNNKKTHEELWRKIRDLIRSITENSDDYDEKYIKIKFNSDEELLLNKTIEINNIIVVRAVFWHYWYFLNERLFKCFERITCIP